MTDHIAPEKMFHEISIIYDQVGFADYSVTLVEKCLMFLHQHDWLGRHIVELGCGTGKAAEYLCQNRMNVTAVDVSPEMLNKAANRLEGRGYSIELAQDDMRVYDSQDKVFDLALSINTLSYTPSIGYLSAVFKRMHGLLRENKMAVFDMWSVGGLATHFGQGSEVLYDEKGVFLAVRNNFSYEAYRLHQQYTFFYEEQGKIYRSSEEHSDGLTSRPNGPR